MALRDLFPGIPFVESSLLHAMIDELDLTAEEKRVALELHERGFAVIDFPDAQLDQRIERIKDFLAPQFGMDLNDPRSTKGASLRVQDAWSYSDDIRAIASNHAILEMLRKLYGRKAFPFQTLNFPVGTQQPLHSDSIHFSSIPERFMCGVWLAMEDISPDAGPLIYIAGSHRWPVLNNTMIGRRGFESDREKAQEPFEKAWRALVEHSRLSQETFLAKKGQALIWAANLLHGGSLQLDPRQTRWSQVTHYYFEDCIYYTPSFSDEPLGRLDLRSIVNVETEALKPNRYLGEVLEETNVATPSMFARIRKWIRTPAGLPSDFDADTYYRLNPDVAIAKLDAAAHYLSHGKLEGRRYRYRSVG